MTSRRELFQQIAEVVGVSHPLLVGIDHLKEAVVAVVSPLRHVGGNRLVGHDKRATGLRHLTHLAVEHSSRLRASSDGRYGCGMRCVRRSNF